MVVTTVDEQTGETIVLTYPPSFDTRTILVKDRIGIDLMVDLEKRQIPGLHQLLQSIGGLGPDDLKATGIFTAYIHNLTLEPQRLAISSMTHQGKKLPAVPLTVTLDPDEIERVDLGRVDISNYAMELKVELAYSSGVETGSRLLTARRYTQEEIDTLHESWKGKKKNVSAFFPD
jgi:hypothetical protein